MKMICDVITVKSGIDACMLNKEVEALAKSTRIREIDWEQYWDISRYVFVDENIFKNTVSIARIPTSNKKFPGLKLVLEMLAKHLEDGHGVYIKVADIHEGVIGEAIIAPGDEEKGCEPHVMISKSIV